MVQYKDTEYLHKLENTNWHTLNNWLNIFVYKMQENGEKGPILLFLSPRMTSSNFLVLSETQKYLVHFHLGWRVALNCDILEARMSENVEHFLLKNDQNNL